MVFIILGLYRNMGNGASLPNPGRSPPPPSAAASAPPPPPPSQSMSMGSHKKTALDLLLLINDKDMSAGLQSTINKLVENDGGTSKNFVLLEFRNKIETNKVLDLKLQLFNRLILNPDEEEVSKQIAKHFSNSNSRAQSIDSVGIWMGAENKQFPALDIGPRSALFKEFVSVDGKGSNSSLLKVVNESNEYNFWKYNGSRNIGSRNIRDNGNFDTIVLLCVISPNNDSTYDLDRNVLESGNLYEPLKDAKDDTFFRILAYKTKRRAKAADATTAPAATGTTAIVGQLNEPERRRAIAIAANIADSNPLTPYIYHEATAQHAAAFVTIAHAAWVIAQSTSLPASRRTVNAYVDAAKNALEQAKIQNSLSISTSNATVDYLLTKCLDILIMLTGGEGLHNKRKSYITTHISNMDGSFYLTTIANKVTPMLLTLLKDTRINKTNEQKLLIVLRNLMSALNIKINTDVLGTAIDILVKKVISTQINDKPELVLGILYNMTFIEGSSVTFNRVLKNGAGRAALQKILNNAPNENIKKYAEGILKTGIATTGGSRRIKKRKIESTRRRHKKHGR